MDPVDIKGINAIVNKRPAALPETCGCIPINVISIKTKTLNKFKQEKASSVGYQIARPVKSSDDKMVDIKNFLVDTNLDILAITDA